MRSVNANDLRFSGRYAGIERSLRALVEHVHAECARLYAGEGTAQAHIAAVARSRERHLAMRDGSNGMRGLTVLDVPLQGANGEAGLLQVGFSSTPGANVDAASIARIFADGCGGGELHLNPPSSSSRSFTSNRARLFESVVVHAGDAILITDGHPIDEPGPIVLYVNEAFEKMTGYRAEEIVGASPRLLQGPLTTAESRRRIREALESWQPLEIELVNYRRDGTQFWVEISIVPVIDESGWVSHWISVQRDVTARREVRELVDYSALLTEQNERLSREITDRVNAEQRLAHIAFHDALTGMRNRGFFVELLSKTLAQVDDQPGRAFAVLFLDLDRFKIVNDSLGHRAGDLLLQEIADRLQRCVRGARGTAARMGGDEFAVLIEDAGSPEAVAELAQRIIAAVGEPVVLEDVSIAVATSIGIAYRAVDGASAAHVLRDADLAMYRAKRSGGNRYTMFDDAMHASALETFRLHGDLRRALHNDEFVAYFQPVVELESGDLLGFEALARWHDPVRGLVPPGSFVPIAEDTGVIVPIGACILRKACEAMKRWQGTFPQCRGLRVSVNVSPVQLADVSFFETVVATLAETGLEGSALELEITENVFLEQPERASELLARLHELGITIAIDDFGTGYSALSYLMRFRADVLKIDRSFTKDVTEHSRDAALVRAIVDLGNVLGLVVLAEGVETEEQRAMLASFGCARAQGYLFGAPEPIDEIERRLREWKPLGSPALWLARSDLRRA